MKNTAILAALLLAGMAGARAQTGLSVGPPRLYFVGGGQAQYVDVSNSSSDYPLDLAVSVEDWAYDEEGNNVISPRASLPTSCADWISVSEAAFSLAPGETKRLQVNIQPPEGASRAGGPPVRTAMVFVTQLNPRDGGKQQEGANIRLSLRSGIKVYHRFNERETADIDITDLRYRADSTGRFLEIAFQTEGNTWMEGRAQTELINQESGEKTAAPEQTFYCLPGDHRLQRIPLPDGLAKGSYTASVMLFHGDDSAVKAAELDISVE